MPIRRRKRKKIYKGKDWIKFKFSPGLWENFLQKCVANGKGADGVISQLVLEWCKISKEQEQTKT
jgi:hypothetical protein